MIDDRKMVLMLVDGEIRDMLALTDEQIAVLDYLTREDCLWSGIEFKKMDTLSATVI